MLNLLADSLLSRFGNFLLANLWLAVPVLLGLAAIALLLPRPRGVPALTGAVLAGAALLAALWFLIRGGAVNPETALFYAFAAIALTAGGLLVTQRNPARAALSFALVVLATCGLFLLQAAPFLMAATIIVYAGAIIVTFLFVIMLAQQSGRSDADHRSREPVLASTAGFVLLGAILYTLGLNRPGGTERPHPLVAATDVKQLDALLGRVQRAAARDRFEEMDRALGGDFHHQFRQVLYTARGAPGATDLATSLSQVQRRQQIGKPDVATLRDALRELERQGRQVRTTWDDAGRSVLPAENVAYLGRVLFTEYLLAVELGGTLLLVATIGAIAITSRRPEEDG